ncbi:MAG TPA: VTT domain-containing protein [Thermomicrobiales bacterium]|jgi:membrane protein DedA with SNARE-associated domain
MVADDRLLPLILHYGLLVAVVLILLGQVGVPTGVPAELVLLLVGGYAVRSIAGLVVGVLLVAAADLAGSLVLFLLVRRGTTGLAARFARAGGRDHARSHDRLRERRAIFLMRALPLVRIYGTVGPGLVRARLRDFLAGSAPAGLIWAGAPLALGFFLREHLAGVAAGYPAGAVSIAAVVPGLVMTAIVLGRLRRRTPSPARASGELAPRSRLASRPPVSPVLQPRPVPAWGAWPPGASGRPLRPYP